jgi:hypothetical protein
MSQHHNLRHDIRGPIEARRPEADAAGTRIHEVAIGVADLMRTAGLQLGVSPDDRRVEHPRQVIEASVPVVTEPSDSYLHHKYPDARQVTSDFHQQQAANEAHAALTVAQRGMSLPLEAPAPAPVYASRLSTEPLSAEQARGTISAIFDDTTPGAYTRSQSVPQSQEVMNYQARAAASNAPAVPQSAEVANYQASMAGRVHAVNPSLDSASTAVFEMPGFGLATSPVND